MKRNGDYVKFQSMYFIFISGLGFFFPYFNVYLEQYLGFSGREMGLVISISLMTSVAVSPIWGALSDQTKQYKLMLKVLLLMYALAAWLLFQMNHLFWVILFTTVMEAVGIGMAPMLDVLAVDYCERTGKDFGKLRIAASIGWVLGSYLAGFFMTTLLFDIGIAMFGPLIGLMTLAFMIAIFIPDLADKEVDQEENLRHASEKAPIKLLFQNKAFVFLMVFNFLTLSLIDSSVAFAGNHLVSTLGAAPAVIGWMNAISVLPEVVFFLFATKLMLKMGFKKFYLLAVMTLLIRFAVYAMTESVFLFLLVGATGPLIMAAAVIGNFLYIKKHVQSQLTGTAFMINAAILTLGRAVFSLIFGVIYDWFGSFMLFKFSMVFFVMALLILLPTRHFDVFHQTSKQMVDFPEA
ncbi:MAG: MFS transporter [Defluviitaleaceae bacterium]|nr:MFS transporter [Defluviitaleaceae bacterium]